MSGRTSELAEMAIPKAHRSVWHCRLPSEYVHSAITPSHLPIPQSVWSPYKDYLVRTLEHPCRQRFADVCGRDVKKIQICIQLHLYCINPFLCCGVCTAASDFSLRLRRTRACLFKRVKQLSCMLGRRAAYGFLTWPMSPTLDDRLHCRGLTERSSLASQPSSVAAVQ